MNRMPTIDSAALTWSTWRRDNVSCLREVLLVNLARLSYMSPFWCGRLAYLSSCLSLRFNRMLDFLLRAFAYWQVNECVAICNFVRQKGSSAITEAKSYTALRVLETFILTTTYLRNCVTSGLVFCRDLTKRGSSLACRPPGFGLLALLLRFYASKCVRIAFICVLRVITPACARLEHPSYIANHNPLALLFK